MPRSDRGSSYPSFSWRCLLGARGFSRTGALTAISRKGTVRNGPTLPGWSFNNVTNPAPLRWRTIAAIRRTRHVPVGVSASNDNVRCLGATCPRTVHYSCSPGPLHLDRPFILPPRRGGVPSGQPWLHGGTVITRPGAVLHLLHGPCPVALVPMWGRSGSSLSGGMFRLTHSTLRPALCER